MKSALEHELESLENDEPESGISNDESFYSLEEARKWVKAPISLPEFAESFFGKEIISELKDLLTCDAIANIDAMVLAGELSDEEANDCIVVMDEFRELILETGRLADRMADSIREKIPHYLASVVQGKRINVRGIQKLLGCAGDMFGPLFENRDAALAFMVVGTTLINRYLGKVAAQISEYLSHHYPKDKDRIMMACLDKKPKTIDLSTMDYLAMAGLCEFEFFFREHIIRFLGLFTQPCDKAESDRLFAQIQSLAQFRKIHFKAYSENSALEFDSLDPKENGIFAFARLIVLCTVTITDPSDPKNTFWKINLDRTSGELIVNSTPLNQVIGSGAAESLKGIVYRQLFDYLKGKPNDIECAPVAPRPVRPPTFGQAILKQVESNLVPDNDERLEGVAQGISGAEVDMNAAMEGATIETRSEVEGRLAEPVPAGEKVPMAKGVALPYRARSFKSLDADEVRRLTQVGHEGRYDQYRVSFQRLVEAIAQAGMGKNRLRLLRVDNDKIYERFREEWEVLLGMLGFSGVVEWVTMDEIKGKTDRAMPLVVPHKLNTHISEGWKRGQQNVFVIEVSSPGLLLSYIQNMRDVLQLVGAREK